MDKEKELSFWDLIGFKWVTLSLTPRLARIIRVLLTIVFLAYSLAGVWVAIEFFIALAIGHLDGNLESIHNIGLVLVAFFGAPFVLWRSMIASDQAKTAAEGLITDRYTKAVDQLGAVRRVPQREFNNDTAKSETWEEEQPNIEVRVGGLYALKRIAEDNLRDHIPVMETICTYLRENSFRQPRQQESIEQGQKNETVDAKPRLDIDAALNILSQRSKSRIEYEQSKNFTLNLTNARLQNCNFNSAALPGTDLYNANLNGCKFRDCDLTQSWLGDVNFQYADLHGCKLDLTALRGANFRNVEGLKQAALDAAYGVRKGYGKTLLPPDLQHPVHWFEAEDAEKDSYDLLYAYRAELTNYYKRTPSARTLRRQKNS